MMGQMLPLVVQDIPPRTTESSSSSPASAPTSSTSTATNPIPIIRSHYTFRSDLPRVLYQVMVYGSAKEHRGLRNAIVNTFLFRLSLIVIVTAALMGGLTLLFINYGGFFSNFFALGLIMLIYIVSQLVWFGHYYRATADRDCYIANNQSDYRKFLAQDHLHHQAMTSPSSPHDPETAVVDPEDPIHYTFNPPPPTYQVSTLEPPAYV